MYENYFESKNTPAPRAQEVAIRARQKEKEMALLNAEFKAEIAPIHGRSTSFLTGIVFGLLSIVGLH